MRRVCICENAHFHFIYSHVSFCAIIMPCSACPFRGGWDVTGLYHSGFTHSDRWCGISGDQKFYFTAGGVAEREKM